MTTRELLIENSILSALQAAGNYAFPQDALHIQLRISIPNLTLSEYEQRVRALEASRLIVVTPPSRGPANLLTITDLGRAELAKS